jgi:hypothetical protein
VPTGHRESVVTLPQGLPVLLFTDGLTEARRADRELLGEDALVRLLDERKLTQADEVLAAVSDAAASTPDDMAACMIVAADPASSSDWTERLIVSQFDVRIERLLNDCKVPAEPAAKARGEVRRLLGQGYNEVLVEVSGDHRGVTVEVEPLFATVAVRGRQSDTPGRFVARRAADPQPSAV